MKEGQNGVTVKTPNNVLFGAGTIHKNLKYDATEKKWNFANSLVGATSGGSKFSIVPEVTPIELDGALVAVKGLNKKTGEVAEMEVNFAEFKSDLIATAALAKIGTSDVDGYDLIESKADIEVGDYWENIAFVGELLNGEKVIFIMDNALCTSGLEVDAKNKEQTIPPAKFACNAEITDDGELNKLPWRMYRPTVA